MSLLQNRFVRPYLIIAIGAIFFALRRLLLPTFFELQNVPFDIAVPSALNSCYEKFALNTCSDGVIVALTILGVIVAIGWNNPGFFIFAVILAIPPLVLYFSLSPIWVPLLALAIIPIALEVGLRILFPPAKPPVIETPNQENVSSK